MRLPLTAGAIAAVVLCIAPSARADDTPALDARGSAQSGGTTGAVRAGVYDDGDQTQVYRALGAIASTFGRWTISGSASVDVISSASVDVRSSPGLSKVDVISSASGGTSTSGGKMSDRRLQATAGGGWRDGSGHGVAISASYANETDYNSINGGFNGSFDLFSRMTTLLGGLSVTRNWIGSVLDKTFARTMSELGWSAGVAQVLSTKDALRLRYDGLWSAGYQASPYRNVRFGDWSTMPGENQRILFVNTIGSADGLPEIEPDTRIRHAGTLEWVHSLLPGLGIHSQARLGIDNWGIKSAAASLDLRADSMWWRLQLSYRFYVQSAADFYQSRYTQAPPSYTYYTSDKELGRELGHTPSLDVMRVLKQPKSPGDTRMLLDCRLTGLFYSYPGFVLLSSRSSLVLDVGLTWEL